MYQWKEDESTDDDNHTTYSYKKVWEEDVINSNTFARGGHDNPNSMEYKTTDFEAESVKIGAYNLSIDQIRRLSANEYLKIESNNYPEGYHVDGNYLTNSANLDNPSIGDIRISWKYNNWQKVSVLAVVSGNSFTDYISNVGKHVNRVEKGTLKSSDFTTKINDENNMMKWIFRALGAFIIFLGYSSILTTLTRFIPILGGIVGAVLGLLALLIGIVHSLIVIAIAWIRFRPILGIALLVIAVGLVILINMIISKNKKKNQENDIPQINEQEINQ